MEGSSESEVGAVPDINVLDRAVHWQLRCELFHKFRSERVGMGERWALAMFATVLIVPGIVLLLLGLVLVWGDNRSNRTSDVDAHAAAPGTEGVHLRTQADPRGLVRVGTAVLVASTTILLLLRMT